MQYSEVQREGGREGGRRGEGNTSAGGLSHRAERRGRAALFALALSHKSPGQLGCSACFKVWDGTTPLGTPPPPLLPPLPLTFHPPSPPSPALPPVSRAWYSPLSIRPDAGKPPWKCVPSPGGCGPHCYLNRCLAVESSQETR